MLERLKGKIKSALFKSRKEKQQQQLVKNYLDLRDGGIRIKIYNIFKADPNIIRVQDPDTMYCVKTQDGGGGYHISFIYRLSTPRCRDEPERYLFRLFIKPDYSLEDLCLAVRDSRLKAEDPERKKSEEDGYTGYWGYIFWKRKLLEEENGGKESN